MRPRSTPRSALPWAAGVVTFGLALGILGALAGRGVAPAAAGDDDIWQQVMDGLYGDLVADLLLTGQPPDTPRSMLLLPENHGLFLARDDGAGWDPVRADPGRWDAVVRAVALGRADPAGRRVYAGLQGRTRFARSSDGGRSWEALAGPTAADRVDRLASGESGRVYAAQSDRASLWTSTDQGTGWEPHDLPGGAEGIVSALFSAPDDPILYLVRGGVLYTSNDDPTAWQPVLGPTAVEPVTRTLTVEHAAIGPRGRLHAVGRTGADEWWMYVSDDRGATWGGEGWPADAGDVAATGVAAGEVRPGLGGVWVTLADGRVYESEDRGATWTLLATLPIRPTRVVADLASEDVWVGTEGLGLYRVKGEALHTGAVPVEALAVDASEWAAEQRVLLHGRILPERRDMLGDILPTVWGLFASQGGQTWALETMTVGLGTQMIASPAFATDHRLYSGRKVSLDRGLTWTDLGAGPAGRPPDVLAVGPITGTAPVLYGLDEPFADDAGGTGLVLSEDGGATWTAVETVQERIVCAVVSPDFVTDRIAFFGTASGFVFQATDGLSFNLTGRIPSFDPFERNLYDMVISPDFTQDGTLLAAVEDPLTAPRANVYMSTNRGALWQPRSVGLEGASRPRRLALSPGFRLDRVVFLGGARHDTDPPVAMLYASDAGGADWTVEGYLPPGTVHDFAWAGSLTAGRLFAAAGTAGLWVRDLAEPIGRAVPSPTGTAGPPTVTPTATRTPSATRTPTAGATAAATTPYPPTPTATPDAGVTPTAAGTPTATADATTTASATATASFTPTSPSPTVTPSPTATVTPSPSPSATPTAGPVRRFIFLPLAVKRA